MYEAFFGLREAPFSTDPSSRFIVCRQAQRALIARLREALLDEGCNVALTGVAGIGKTITGQLLARAVPETVDVTVMARPPTAIREVLERLVERPGPAGQPLRELVLQLREQLLASHRAGRTPLLIIDDAHRIPPDVLKRLQRLLDARIRGRRALPVLLLGRHATAGNLALGEGSFLDLADREIRTEGMDFPAARDYIQHKLRAADGDPGLVTPAALRRLLRRSRGVARHLDIACDRALQTAYLNDSDRVDVRDVRRAFADPDRPRLLVSLLPRRALVALPLLLALAGTAGLLHWWSSLGPAAGREPAADTATAGTVELPGQSRGGTAVVNIEDLALSSATARAVAERRLLAHWGEQFSREPEQPLCRSVRSMAYKCMQGWGSWQDLERLNRPAILTLWHNPRFSFHAVVAGLDDTHVLLDVDGRVHRFSREEIQRVWHGEYLVLWRPPLEDVEVINAESGPDAVGWLREAMARLEGDAVQAAAGGTGGEFDWPLIKRIMAFQSSVGIRPDGTVGPSTFIALTSALGADQAPTIVGKTAIN